HYKLGAGVQYAFSPSLLMRGEAERYRINDSVGHHGAVTMLSVSLVVPFGRTDGPPPRAAYSPPPPVAAPAPPPVVVVMAPPAPAPMPAPVVPRRVSFSAESLFGFDKAQLRPEGKAALDTFARELQGTQFSTVQVEGHTDRLGTPAYNQTLSMSRAESVKSYLVTSGQVDPAKLAAVGKGETMPVTKPEDCKGNRASPALIACLQPDRRVEIEVIGTR
ncbi:OmpA family protein, partial [Ideonella sp.]|uniref:OmpA family protein n=1 Tax=Ideonella sp. TaxID=1929293 RepID=UPI003BB7C56E